MKIKTVLVAGLAGGIGYVLGTKAGTDRYEEILAKADQLAKSPQVQDTVANLAENVKKTAAKLPDPVADVVTSVADKATASTGGGAAGAAAAAGAASDPVGLSDTSDLGSSDFGGTSDLADSSDLGDSTDLGSTSGLGDTTGYGDTTGLGETVTIVVDEPSDPFGEPGATTDPFDSTDQPPRNL